MVLSSPAAFMCAIASMTCRRSECTPSSERTPRGAVMHAIWCDTLNVCDAQFGATSVHLSTYIAANCGKEHSVG